MVFTPFHAGFVIPLWMKFRRLDLPALLIGAMVPDLEVPFIWLLTQGEANRLVLHSFFGALVAGVPLAAFLALFALPPLLRLLPKTVLGLDLWFLGGKRNSLAVVSLSALLGAWSHVLIDTLNYHLGTANPLLWPFSGEGFVFLLMGSRGLSINFWFFAGVALTLASLYALNKAAPRSPAR